MKQTFRFIPVILATAALLASCAKEPVLEQNGSLPQEEGSRVIAVSFAGQPQTKTALGEDGLTPEFLGGERVMVSNGTKSEECVVTVYGNGTARILAHLQGALTAVYPATAAKMNGNTIGGAKVSSVQDGTFANANICMAEMLKANETSLHFHNRTALFVVNLPAGTKRLMINSLPTIGSDGQRSGITSPINNSGGNAQAQSLISVGDGTSELSSPCYVSLVPGVKLSDLSFNASYETKGTGAVKGIPINDIEDKQIEDITSEGIAYTINEDNWHDYVTIDGRKWATMNLGADTPEEYGEYFAWGGVMGHIPDGSSFVFPANNPDPSRYTGSWDASKGFYICNAPYYDGNDYSNGKYHFTNNGKTELELMDDAAYVRWGGAWRMPKGGENSEFSYFIDNSTWTEDYNNTGVSGRVVIDGQLSLFLPAAGDGFQKTFNNSGNMVHYWTRTLSNSSSGDGINTNAYMLQGPYESASLNNETGRFRGNSIRAIVDESAWEPDPDGTKGQINGHDYLVIGGKKWATQNVAVSTSGQMKWKGNGTSAIKLPGTNADVEIGDFFQWAAHPGYCGDASNPDKGMLIYSSFTHPYCENGGTTGKIYGKPYSDSKTYRFHYNNYDSYVGIAPYCISLYEWEKYQGTGDNMDGKTIIEQSDDIANTLWGETWRLPSPDEFRDLCAACFVEWDDVAKGLRFYPAKNAADKGLLHLPNAVYSPKWKKISGTEYENTTETATIESYDATTDIHLFFPAVGKGEKIDIISCGEEGYYMSNTIVDFSCDIIRHLEFGSTISPIPYKMMSYRFDGLPIRPISD